MLFYLERDWVLAIRLNMAAIELVETMGDQTFVCFTLRTLTVIRIQTISITKVNDKEEGSAIPARIDAVFETVW